MNVGLMIGSPQTGGTERQVWHLSRRLASFGCRAHLVFLIARRQAEQIAPRLDFGNLPQHYLGLRRWNRPWMPWACRRLVARAGLDVVHLFNLEAMEFAKALKFPGAPRLIGSVRGIGFAKDARQARQLACAARHLDAITVNSRQTEELLVACGVCDREKIVFIANGAELPPPRAPRPTEACANVLFAGTLKPVKDPECFISAALLLVQRGCACRFTIAGDGPLLDSLRELVARAHCADRFQFLGRVAPEKVPYAQADIVVSSSIREGTSNTLLEALAHGIPVVATDVGGSGQLLAGGTGLSVPPRQPLALANAMERLVADPSLRARMGEAGRACVEEQFGMEQMVQQHRSLYERTLREGGASPAGRA